MINKIIINSNYLLDFHENFHLNLNFDDLLETQFNLIGIGSFQSTILIELIQKNEMYETAWKICQSVNTVNTVNE